MATAQIGRFTQNTDGHHGGDQQRQAADDEDEALVPGVCLLLLRRPFGRPRCAGGSCGDRSHPTPLPAAAGAVSGRVPERPVGVQPGG
jgi:hypothetical protein